MNTGRESLLPRLAMRLLPRLLRLLGATWRIRVEGDDPLRGGVQGLGAFWHEAILVVAYLFRDRGYTAMVSRSRDGDLIEAMLQRMGYAPSARGSTSRGGLSAMLTVARRLRRGETVAIIVDGPRGPARHAQEGVVAAASRSGVAITPLAINATPCIRFGSWDRTMLPLPFARVVLRFGEPLAVPPCEDEAQLHRQRGRLQTRLDDMSSDVERELGLVA